MAVLLTAQVVVAQTTGTAPATNTVKARMNHTAKGSFEVKLAALNLSDVAAQEKLGRMSIDKVFAGDIAGTSKGEMLSSMGEVKGSAGYVAMERVTASVNGRKGSFVLQHSSVMNRGAPVQSIQVVPDSGTGELTGISGSFRIVIEPGKHLYEFSYQLPE